MAGGRIVVEFVGKTFSATFQQQTNRHVVASGVVGLFGRRCRPVKKRRRRFAIGRNDVERNYFNIKRRRRRRRRRLRQRKSGEKVE